MNVLLWIALKSWYLWYSEQLNVVLHKGNRCCELLSKVDIFDIRNNAKCQFMSVKTVVNCSQKLISLIFGTTNRERGSARKPLWIALKSWYLWYSEQPEVQPYLVNLSCELLSKVDIFDIRNNRINFVLASKSVVNCSQKLISLIFGTTIPIRKHWYNELWIALKSWYLWYSEQLIWTDEENEVSCELLSKVDIFDIRNNLFRVAVAPGGVVNCSQKLISLIFGTTTDEKTMKRIALWIALKSWYLWYSEQQM